MYCLSVNVTTSFFFLMNPLPPRSTRTDTLLPDTTLFRSRALPQTAASAEALRAYDATVEADLGFELATGDRLKETFALDPAMPMAHCLTGCFLLLFAQRDLTHRAAGALATARTVPADTGLTARETQPLDALEAWLGGGWPGPAARSDAILADPPAPIPALQRRP